MSGLEKISNAPGRLICEFPPGEASFLTFPVSSAPGTEPGPEQGKTLREAQGIQLDHVPVRIENWSRAMR